MTLIKTSLLNAVAVCIKMLAMLGINKILAVYVGPAGYAVLGQFQNAVQMITTFSGGAINTGVTKYTAEYLGDEDKIKTVWRTAGTISLIGGLLTAFIVFLFRVDLSLYFLKDSNLSDIFIYFSIGLVFFILNAFFLAVLNGKKEIRSYVIANILGSLCSVAFTSVLAVFMGLYGALIALATYQSFSFFTTIIICYRKPWFSVTFFFGKIEPQVASNLFKFTAMALTSAIVVPMSHIYIRNHIGESLGLNYAGYWEALWRLSGAYMMIFTTTLTVYYLPRLSELKTFSSIKKELVKGYIYIMPLFLLAAFFVFLLKEPLVDFLFTSEFRPLNQMIAWQLLGDCFKMASWIIGFCMHSKGFFRLFIFSEIAFSFLFYCLAVTCLENYGMSGMGVAHFINYVIYFLFISVSVIYLLKKNTQDDTFVYENQS